MQIDKLTKLKELAKYLEKVNYEEIYELITKLELNHIYRYSFSPGKEIVRIRPSQSKPFNHKSQISYNSENPPDKFGRANKRKQPMFYGSYKPPGEFSEYATSFAEINHILENGKYEFVNNAIELTYGVWTIKESFKVIPIVFHSDYLKENPEYAVVVKALSDSKEVSRIELRELEFISEEFAKCDIKSHLEYQISAAFANYVIDKSKGVAEAITYPSVRTKGKGYNICLTPNFVDKYLELKEVFTAILYAKDGIGILDKKKFTDKIYSDGSFILKEIVKSGINKDHEWYMSKLEELSKEPMESDKDYGDYDFYKF